jgi:hypothetical protein
LAEPGNEVSHIEGLRGKQFHHLGVNAYGVGTDATTIDPQEHIDDRERHTLVAVHERMVLYQALK